MTNEDVPTASLAAQCDSVAAQAAEMRRAIDHYRKSLVKVERAAKRGELAQISGLLADAAASAAAIRTTDDVSAPLLTDHDALKRYLHSGYRDELEEHARRHGHSIVESEGELWCNGLPIEIDVKRAEILIEGDKVRSLHPGVVTAQIAQRGARPFDPQRFADDLHRGYQAAGGDSDRASAISLWSIHRALARTTPKTTPSYRRFGCDVDRLRRSGVLSTSTGLTWAFVSSGGARDGKRAFSVVGPDARRHIYYAVEFKGVPT